MGITPSKTFDISIKHIVSYLIDYEHFVVNQLVLFGSVSCDICKRYSKPSGRTGRQSCNKKASLRLIKPIIRHVHTV